jgi:hypothetical protein
MDKATTNNSLSSLCDAVIQCRNAIGLDEQMILTVVRSILEIENSMNGSDEKSNEQFEFPSDNCLANEYRKLSNLNSVLAAKPQLAIKWSIYTKNRVNTRRELLEKGFDVRNVDLIDGN